MGEVFGFDLNNVFTDMTVVESALSNGSTFTVFDSKGQEWSAAYDMAGNIMIGGMVPEPSTYAALLGAIALAFAAYRRRR